MARPTKNAALICGILSVVAVIGIIIGLLAKSPIVVLIAMAPSVAYEVYRTEGETTRWASWALAGVLVLEFILIVRTRGVYTRWLAVNIIVSALALTYVLDPAIAAELLRQGAQEGLDALN